MPDAAIKKPITDEIATTDKDLDIFAGWLGRLENPDPTLSTEARGKGLKLYDEVARDSHAGSVLQTRYLAPIGREWEVLAADDSKAAKGIADSVEAALLATNFTQACQELLQAILYGFFVIEIMWGLKNGLVVPVKMIGKHPRRFVFDMQRNLKLLTPQNMIAGESLPERKFVVFSYGSSDNPYGSGLGQKLWWPVWFKKNGIKFWLTYLEKFGMPTVKGKYPPGTPPEQQQALLDAIDALQTETGIKIPNTMELELMEATRSGQDSYGPLCEYMDKQISKAVLGQTATTEGTPGKLGSDKAQSDVRQDILQADADLLCECLNDSLIRWMVDYNFPAVEQYPKLWIRTDPEQDLKDLAERDKVLVNEIGLPVGRRYFYQTYAIPEPEPGEELVQPAAAATSPAFAEGQRRFDGSQQAVENLVAASMPDATQAMRDLRQPVLRIVRESRDLEEVRERLFAAYGDMGAADLEDLIARAMFTAELFGRATIGSK